MDAISEGSSRRTCMNSSRERVHSTFFQGIFCMILNILGNKPENTYCQNTTPGFIGGTFPKGTCVMSSISVTPGRIIAPLKYPPYANSATINIRSERWGATQQIKRILHKMIHNIHGTIPLARLLQDPHHLFGTPFKNLLLVKEKFLCKRGADKSSHAHCVLGFLC